jgi:hypothetical protein
LLVLSAKNRPPACPLRHTTTSRQRQPSRFTTLCTRRNTPKPIQIAYSTLH